MTKEQYYDAMRIQKDIEFLENLADYLAHADIKREASVDELREFTCKMVKAGFISPLKSFMLELKHEAELRIEELETEFERLGNE